ncbi:uncharacterized protein LOC133928306 [Phragmites australis]|uniref:uncharacterized protein LOC133928306 n=1 Tax=Phragmites australis TaxID=29695 RepID=UPI002D7923A2|nr:uncharacterized protein LOC133928306 [Phragmites australis]
MDSTAEDPGAAVWLRMLFGPGVSRLVPHPTFSNPSDRGPHTHRPSTVTDMMPRFRLWPACSEVGVGPTTQPRRAPPRLSPKVQNLPWREAGRRHAEEEEEEEESPSAEERGRSGEERAEAVMLRGSGGASRASAKPRRPHPRPRPPSPPAPSRRARAAPAATESKEASVLEAPVVSSVEETSFTFEFKRRFKRAKKAVFPPMGAPRGEENLRECLSNKANAAPAKTPLAKEGPKQVEFTHCAPGIVARLMGLDTMPRPEKVLDRCQSDIRANRQRHLSGVVQEVARGSSGDQPCNISADELPSLKDVFEVTEMENMVMHELLKSGNEKPHLRSNEVDLEFVRQKFLDAKRLSTDEVHRNSKEFSEALEILHSKKDVFLEILQENRSAVSGISGHILSHSGLQCSHTSNAAAEQSFEQEFLCSMEGVSDGMLDEPKESEKPIPSMLLKETSVMPLELLAPNGSKSKGSGHRSQIVVLKPNLRKKSFTPVLSSQQASQYNQRSAQYSKGPRHNIYKQVVMHSVPPNNEVLEQEGGITKQKVRIQTPKSGSRRRPSEDEYNLAVDSETKVASASHDDTMPIDSSMHFAGSSVSRKARKHLSERWQMACTFGSENSIPKGMKTLGEMLELSDRDAPKVTSHKRQSDPHFNCDDVRKMPANSLGISSKDGWKTGIYCEDNLRDGASRNFPRSKSLPALSTRSTELPGGRQSAPTCRLPILKDILNTPTDESGNSHVRKRSPIRSAKQKSGRAIVLVGKENMLPEKEIHVTSEKARHSICVSDLSRSSNIYTEKYPDDAIRAGDPQASDSAVQHDDKQNSEGHMGRTNQKLPTLLPETKQDLSIHNQDSIVLKEGRNPSVEIDVAEVNPQAIQSALTASAESCECSSPTSSSQQSSGEETSYFGIFKSINVGIQELRVQLKMLNMEDQDDICGDYSDTSSSDECNNMNISTYQAMEEQLPIFKDEADRDFSYVQDMIASVCDLPHYPEDWQVSSDVFLGLENKYSKLLLWSKSDRKLLFDLVNSILADMTAPGSSLHSKIMIKCWPEMDCGQLAENIWQMVQKQCGYEHFAWDSVQPLPLDHHPKLELIEMEIIKMIHDDIIEDFIVEFMLQENHHFIY